ncbi:hypothetical protein CHUAL_002042 [Chamberlinius hualienensis]
MAEEIITRQSANAEDISASFPVEDLNVNKHKRDENTTLTAPELETQININTSSSDNNRTSNGRSGVSASTSGNGMIDSVDNSGKNVISSQPSCQLAEETTTTSYAHNDRTASIAYTDSVALGIQRGMEECKTQFAWERWNCPDSSFTKTKLLPANRETAFVQAITAAGVAYTVTKNCSMGHIEGCGCDDKKLSEQGGSEWKWGGCSDNIQFGFEISRDFLDSREHGKDPKAIVTRHNSVAGRQGVLENMKKTCKCHGVSGSCSIQTCWMQMSDFGSIGTHLKSRYDNATKVEYVNGILTLKENLESNLVYLESSPDYCLANLTGGSHGTIGRECSSKKESCRFSTGTSDLIKEIKENTPVGSEIFKLQVFPRVKFALASNDGNPIDVSYFRHEELGSKDIIIRLTKSIEDLVDQENPKTFMRFKLACFGANGTEVVHVPVEVRIRDVNDHVPEFMNAPYNLEINELTPVGSTVFRGIKAIDGDQPKTENSRITYLIKNGNTRDTFSIPDRSQGHLVLVRPLDYDEGSREFHLEIQAQDQGNPSLTVLTTVSIKIQDTDDQNPTFTQDLYQVRIREKASIMGLPIREKLHIVPRIEAYDKDKAINSSIRYSILSGNDKLFFDINSEDGAIYVVQEIDREALAETSFSLQIQAAQSDNPLRQGLARVDIEVLDINDNPPIFDTKAYNISILENAPIGFSVTQVHASDDDKDENANFRYRLEDSSGAFSIDPLTGWITVEDPNKLDRERNSKLKFKASYYKALVFADEEVVNVLKDIEPSFTTVEVQLLDTNDNNPTFIPKSQYVFNVSELAEPEDGPIGTVLARDPDLGENGAVFYYLPNDTFAGRPPFRVDARNGSIYVTDVYSSTHDKPLQYTMFIAAADRPQSPKERRFSLAVVNINVIDANNNPPELLGMPYEGIVGENLPEGTLVLEIRVRQME